LKSPALMVNKWFVSPVVLAVEVDELLHSKQPRCVQKSWLMKTLIRPGSRITG
jgi:hypothetical protein